VEDLHRKLYLQAEAAGGEPKAFYLNPVWPFYEVVANSYKDRDNYNTTRRNISFVNFVFDYVSKQRSFWWYPITQVMPYDSDTFWLENNGATQLMNALNASLFQSSSTSEGTSAVVAMSNYAVLGVALSIFCLVALVSIIPAIGVVLAEQESIFQVYGQVPLHIVRGLRDSLSAKIAALKQADETNGEDQAALEVGGWGEAAAGGSVEDAAAAAAASSASAAHAHAVASAAGAAEAAVAVTSELKPVGGRTFHRAAGQRAALSLRLLWPVGFFFLYFSLTFWWRQMVNEQASYFRREVLWGAELQVLIPNVAYSLRNALVYGSPVKWVPSWINITSSQLDLAKELVDSLSYGSTARGLRPALTNSPTAYRLLLENGCVRNEVDKATCANYGKRTCDYYYKYDYCFMPPGNTDISYSVFSSGVVGTGLLPALRQFIMLTQNMLNARAAELAAAPRGTTLSRVDLTAPPLSTVDQLGRQYLPAGLEALSKGRVGEDSAYLAQFGDLNLTATLLCVAALIAIYLLFYRPLFARLDKDIKGTRGLLLLLPDDAARAVPAVMVAGKRLLGSA